MLRHRSPRGARRCAGSGPAGQPPKRGLVRAGGGPSAMRHCICPPSRVPAQAAGARTCEAVPEGPHGGRGACLLCATAGARQLTSRAPCPQVHHRVAPALEGAGSPAACSPEQGAVTLIITGSCMVSGLMASKDGAPRGARCSACSHLAGPRPGPPAQALSPPGPPGQTHGARRCLCNAMQQEFRRTPPQESALFLFFTSSAQELYVCMQCWRHRVSTKQTDSTLCPPALWPVAAVPAAPPRLQQHPSAPVQSLGAH